MNYCPQCGELNEVDNESCQKCHYDLWRENEWIDMPEFIQTKQEEFAKIIVRFDDEKSLNEFSKLINQKLTKKTKSIWFPYKSHWKNKIIRWIDES